MYYYVIRCTPDNCRYNFTVDIEIISKRKIRTTKHINMETALCQKLKQ